MDTNKPLFGKKIVITRNTIQSVNISNNIESLGGSVISFPTLKIVPPDSWEECDSSISKLHNFDWVIFTSTNGVKCFFNRLKNYNASLDRLKIAAVGENTKNLIVGNGYEVSIVPDNYSAGGLVHAFENIDISNKKILIPISDIANRHFYNDLRDKGAQVIFVTVYRTVPNNELSKKEILDEFTRNEIDCITFFSPSAFRFFIQILGESVKEKIKQLNIPIAAIGKTTAKEVERLGLTTEIIPDRSSDESMIKAILNYFVNKPGRTH